MAQTVPRNAGYSRLLNGGLEPGTVVESLLFPFDIGIRAFLATEETLRSFSVPVKRGLDSRERIGVQMNGA